ncbi:regulator of chromosome condensation-like protein [Bacillus methanolicus PB1]|uniref:Regulator of chromosome condensation-like protein n=1 Tax=Bacillus methanolicus PB1 TaxID=997296 RepID=I3DUW1_BACMT|nr:HYR domain-containing protein [Bacillus methanolicus]EIJ78032.1 regulator of chromosome condensation-like protein [Bacillus methanolicus PB1]
MTTFSWGNNEFGQLGDGTNIDSNVPVSVNGSTNSIAITGGIFHSLSVLSDGLVCAWGANYSGQLGDGTLNDSNIPEIVTALTNAIEVAAGVFHSLALLSNSTVRAWGDNFAGQLGDGTFNSSTVPVSVIGLTNAIAISAGLNHSLALLNDGTVRAWGGNFFGQLGNGTDITSNAPVIILGLSNVVAVSAGGEHSLALLYDGTVCAWGANYSGQLGDGTNTDRSIPVQVKGIGGSGVLNNVIAISAGEFHSLALLNDGTVLAWGNNDYGQLGDGTNTESNVPVQVKGTGGYGVLNNVAAIAAGGFHSLALLNDGTVLAWGNNESGQLGDGSNSDSDIPVTVSGLTNSNTIAGGGDHSLDIQLPPPPPPPTIICPADIIQLNDPGLSGAIVDFPPPSVSDQCPDGFTVFCTPPSGSFFPMGTTTVKCTVTDQCGGFATCSFNVTVKDFIVECFLSDSKGNPLNPLGEGSILCSEIGDRKDVIVSLPNREPITLQKVNILKSGFVVVEVISRNMSKKTLPIPFHVIEALLLCAPVGTSVHCKITDFVCEARIIRDTNQNFQQLDLFISICQSVHTEAEVKLEVKGKLCVPRKEITTSLSEPIPHPVEGAVPSVHCIRTSKVYDWVTFPVNIKLRLGSDQVKFIC